MSISGKHVVVTGGGSGIGAAIAQKMALAGAKVTVSDLDVTSARSVASGIDGVALACDVTQEQQIIDLITAAESAQGPIDIFVSNAGLGRGDPSHAASASDDMWMLNWNVHVMAHVWAARALLPKMIDRGAGHFVNVASAAGLLNQIGDAAYSATKHAAVSFAESLAITHKSDGISASVVCPQYVATPLLGLENSAAEDLENLLTADDVADAVVQGVEAKKFLILSHPQVKQYTLARAHDHDRWVEGMQLLRSKAQKEFGDELLLNLYKLV